MLGPSRASGKGGHAVFSGDSFAMPFRFVNGLQSGAVGLCLPCVRRRAINAWLNSRPEMRLRPESRDFHSRRRPSSRLDHDDIPERPGNPLFPRLSAPATMPSGKCALEEVLI